MDAILSTSQLVPTATIEAAPVSEAVLSKEGKIKSIVLSSAATADRSTVGFRIKERGVVIFPDNGWLRPSQEGATVFDGLDHTLRTKPYELSVEFINNSGASVYMACHIVVSQHTFQSRLRSIFKLIEGYISRNENV